MRITESRLRRIISEEAAATLQESFLSKAADFFGSSNRTGTDVKMRAFDLLDHASFERWPGASTWERKLRDITKMGQHTAAERLGAVQGAEEAFKSWLRRDAETRASAEDAKWKSAEARRQRDDKESWRKADAESERRREEFRKKLESEDLVPTGEDASGNLMYTTRDDFERQRSSGRSPIGSISLRESRIRQIIRAEALRVLRESEFNDFGGGEEMGDPLMDDDEMDDGGEYEDEEMTVQSVIERYKNEGPSSWRRISNDFHEMADGGMDDIREKYYPGLTADDCAMIAAELDSYFGMD